MAEVRVIVAELQMALFGNRAQADEIVDDSNDGEATGDHNVDQEDLVAISVPVASSLTGTLSSDYNIEQLFQEGNVATRGNQFLTYCLTLF